MLTQSRYAFGSVMVYQLLLVMIAASITARLIVLNGRCGLKPQVRRCLSRRFSLASMISASVLPLGAS